MLNKWKNPLTGKQYDLAKKNLPVAATFICESRGLKLFLIPMKEFYNEGTKMHERIDDSGYFVKFRGGCLVVEEKGVLDLLMDCADYVNGKVRINPEDPTGFWRQAGLLQTKIITVVAADKMIHPKYEDIDLSLISKDNETPKLGEEVVEKLEEKLEEEVA